MGFRFGQMRDGNLPLDQGLHLTRTSNGFFDTEGHYGNAGALLFSRSWNSDFSDYVYAHNQ